MLFKFGNKTVFPTLSKKSINANITLSTVLPSTWGEAQTYTWGGLASNTWGDVGGSD